MLGVKKRKVVVSQMDFAKYQQETSKFRQKTYTPEACVLGLLAEAGEVAAVFQKLIRGDYDYAQALAKLEKELGDVLWHIAQIAEDNNWELQEIARINIDKLESRLIRNKILGAGDER